MTNNDLRAAMGPVEERPEQDLASPAGRIKSRHESGEAAVRRGLDCFRQVGAMLLEATRRCPRGGWAKFVAGLPFGERQARRYMLLAKTDVTSDLEAAWRVISGNASPDVEPAAAAGPDPPAAAEGRVFAEGAGGDPEHP